MNYRHAFHAGNFADVLKHAVLALVVEHLKQKPAPFRVIDTHAGAGRYDLSGAEARRTGEWRGGIGRLVEARLDADVAAMLAPYLEAVRAGNDDPVGITSYPGSPLVARRLLRRGDQLVANELHPEDHAVLQATFAGDPQVKVLALDGWTALKSLLPPRERRGVILVDPPFEEAGDLYRLADGLREAIRRFETGIYLLWYPIKDPKRLRPFQARLAGLGLPRSIVAELMIRRAVDPDRLNGCGLVIVNPPYLLRDRLDRLLPVLADLLASGPGAEGRCHGPALTER